MWDRLFGPGDTDPAHARILELIPCLSLFQGVPENAFPDLVEGLEWFSLPGGWTLMRRGEESDAMYIVSTGSLGMMLPDGAGGDTLAGQFVTGQTVGEVALLSGEPRTATLVALRDTELLCISRDVFHRIIEKHPVVMENLGRLLVRRLKDMMEGRGDPEARPAPPKTVALVPVTPGVPCLDMGERLVAALKRMGRRAILVDKLNEDQGSEWFHQLEARHDHILYLSDGEPARWSQLCLRQADRILLLARHDGLSPYTMPMEDLVLQGPRRFVELAILYPPGTDKPTASAAWVKRFHPEFHHNLCTDDQGAVERLARHMAGRATGIVLAGGGARGFAHLGVLRALEEAGITIDMICGASMGAIIGAGVATGWSIEELTERIQKSFVDTNPLSDITVPFVSFVRGRKVSRLLRENFGKTRIEDLWLPFFCVSANLTQGRQAIHRTDLVWRALRATIAIPGILPPVVRHGDILVDGAVMNNFPVSLMAQTGRGPTIGVDVEDHQAFTTVRGDGWRQVDWGIIGDTVLGGPGIVSLLMRAGTVNSEMQTRVARARADLLFEPPLEDIGVPDWKACGRAADAGYAHAAEVLEKADLSGFWRA